MSNKTQDSNTTHLLTVLAILFFLALVILPDKNSNVSFLEYSADLKQIKTTANISSINIKKSPRYPPPRCSPKRFVFLKNHKAGSSTLRLLLMQFQSRNPAWKMTLPVNGIGPWLGGWPGPFNSTFYENIPKTDIIYDHLRWNWKEIEKVLQRIQNNF